MDNDNGLDSGSVYVFKREGAQWIEMTKLIADDGEADDYFGFSVAISGDFILIGAPNDADNGRFSGSIYLFKLQGSEWIQINKVTPSDAAPVDVFGFAVAIDENHAVVGAPEDDDNGDRSGSAYIYDLTSEPTSIDGQPFPTGKTDNLFSKLPKPHS